MDERDCTAEALKTALRYEAETGLFYWIERHGKRGIPGRVAGTVDVDGYVVVTLNGKRHKGHRLAWLFAHGRWPAVAVDHINGVKHDNRLTNLREADWAQNQHNRRLQKNNKSGFMGVHFCSRSGKWRAAIRAEGRGRNLGGYDSPEEAHSAYLRAKAALHPFQPVPRSA
jgi:hypothetical protein